MWQARITASRLLEELHQLLDGVLRCATALLQFDDAEHGKVD